MINKFHFYSKGNGFPVKIPNALNVMNMIYVQNVAKDISCNLVLVFPSANTIWCQIFYTSLLIKGTKIYTPILKETKLVSFYTIHRTIVILEQGK